MYGPPWRSRTMATIPQLEAELRNASAHIADLESRLVAAREWKTELATALKVERHLSERGAHSDARQEFDANSIAQVSTHQSRRGRSRSSIVIAADEALTAMLRKLGSPIKQLDAVKRLREEHGIVIGTGEPDRATSDLSAALGNGKSEFLRVSRKDGWSLVEWGNKADIAEEDSAIKAEIVDLYTEIHKRLNAFNEPNLQAIQDSELDSKIRRYKILEEEYPQYIQGSVT